MSLISSRSLRSVGLCGIAAAAIVSGSLGTAAADSIDMPRVRSSHAYIRAMIDEAGRRSPSFRRLVETIDATDGIVYVEDGTCGHSVRACLTMSISSAAQYRILRVLIDVRQPDWEVMASIGHELRHAIEVLGNTSLKTTEAIYLFYKNEASHGAGESFETEAAISAGNKVRNEVGSFARRKWK
jgi:hypothetical protein